MLYTHMSFEDIKNLTITQYSDLLYSIQNKQIWDLQNHTVAMSGEFDENKNPLYAFDVEQENKKMTVDDLNNLVSFLS